MPKRAAAVTALRTTTRGKSRISEAERQARIDLAAAYRLAAHFEMTDLIYTHFSCRVPGTDRLLLNPYGQLFDEITASSLVCVDLAGKLYGEAEPADMNLFGFKIHSPFYIRRPDIACVLHTHTRAGMAISALDCGILPITQSALDFYGSVSYHAYEGNAFYEDEQKRLLDNLGPNKAMVLRNHGLLTVGGSVAEAFSLMYYLELCCKVQLDAMASGAKLIEIPDPIAAPLRDMYHANQKPFSKREWPALLRLLDRVNPGYDG
jgi:ribulose-5-phosphate 4-epimerase/fuculose-1-phosphate aldolase